MELDDKVCLCFHVSKRKIQNFIRIHRPRVPSQISECNSAGTGCGWCVPFLKRYFEQYKANEAAQSPATNASATDDAMTAAEYAAQRAAYIQAGGGTPPPGATPLPDSGNNVDE